MRTPDTVRLYSEPQVSPGLYPYPSREQMGEYLEWLAKKGPGISQGTLGFCCIWFGMPEIAVDYQWFTHTNGAIEVLTKLPNRYGLKPNHWYVAIEAMLIARMSWEGLGCPDNPLRTHLLSEFARFSLFLRTISEITQKSSELHRRYGWNSLGDSWAYINRGIGPDGKIIEKEIRELRFGLNAYNQELRIGFYTINELWNWLLRDGGEFQTK